MSKLQNSEVFWQDGRVVNPQHLKCCPFGVVSSNLAPVVCALFGSLCF